MNINKNNIDNIYNVFIALESYRKPANEESFKKHGTDSLKKFYIYQDKTSGLLVAQECTRISDDYRKLSIDEITEIAVKAIDQSLKSPSKNLLVIVGEIKDRVIKLAKEKASKTHTWQKIVTVVGLFLGILPGVIFYYAKNYISKRELEKTIEKLEAQFQKAKETLSLPLHNIEALFKAEIDNSKKIIEKIVTEIMGDSDLIGRIKNCIIEGVFPSIEDQQIKKIMQEKYFTKREITDSVNRWQRYKELINERLTFFDNNFRNEFLQKIENLRRQASKKQLGEINDALHYALTELREKILSNLFNSTRVINPEGLEKFKAILPLANERMEEIRYTKETDSEPKEVVIQVMGQIIKDYHRKFYGECNIVFKGNKAIKLDNTKQNDEGLLAKFCDEIIDQLNSIIPGENNASLRTRVMQNILFLHQQGCLAPTVIPFSLMQLNTQQETNDIPYKIEIEIDENGNLMSKMKIIYEMKDPDFLTKEQEKLEGRAVEQKPDGIHFFCFIEKHTTVPFSILKKNRDELTESDMKAYQESVITSAPFKNLEEARQFEAKQENGSNS